MSYKHTKHDYSSVFKICTSCNTEFPREQTEKHFRKESRNKDGFSYICKKCKTKIDKKSREKNWETFKKYQKSPNFVYAQLKYQAKKRGIKFEISFDFYTKKLAHEDCFYCGDKNTKHWIDRFLNDHEVGYTEKNSVSCCEKCNKMKISLDPHVFIKHCGKVYKNSKTKTVGEI